MKSEEIFTRQSNPGSTEDYMNGHAFLFAERTAAHERSMRPAVFFDLLGKRASAEVVEAANNLPPQPQE